MQSTIELTDPGRMKALLAGAGAPQPKVNAPRMTKFREGDAPVYQPPASKSHRRHCRCGTCPVCLEDARWERIFQEKFADPCYYQRCFDKVGSSLNGFDGF